MVKIPIVDFLKDRALEGDASKRTELMQRTLAAIEAAKFDENDIKEFLITAFKDICAGKEANKALLLKGSTSGKSVKQDVVKSIAIGEQIYFCHNTLIEGKTKNRRRKTLIANCIQIACKEHNIAFDTAKDYYKQYKNYRKYIDKINQ